MQTDMNSEYAQSVVATIEGRDVTQGELSQAFNWVADPDNWKRPIHCVVVLSPRQIALVQEAVPFFTGSQAEVDALPNGSVRVTAAGYYATCGA